MPRRELALAPEPLLRHRLYGDMRVKLAAPSPGSFRNEPVPSISPGDRGVLLLIEVMKLVAYMVPVLQASVGAF